MNNIVRFLRDESGPVAVEYAILLSLISVASIGAVSAVGMRLKIAFTNIADRLEEAGI